MTKGQKIAAGALLATLSGLAGREVGDYLSARSGAPTLGDHIVASGYSAAVSRVGSVVQETPASAMAPLDWSNYGVGGDPAAWDAAFLARYGAHVSANFGTPHVGIACKPTHRLSGDALERIIRHPSNPFGIEANQTYGVTRTEIEDLRWLTRPGMGCSGLAIDNLIFPAGCSVGVLLDGCPAPPDPTPTPTPTPTPAPPPGYTWTATVRDCQPPAVCVEIRFTPGVNSTGRMPMEIRQ